MRNPCGQREGDDKPASKDTVGYVRVNIIGGLMRYRTTVKSFSWYQTLRKAHNTGTTRKNNFP